MKKVATGISDPLKKIQGALSPNVTVDNSGNAEANAAIAAAQEAANNLKKNFSVDLTNENISNVVAGGSAADSAVGLEQGGRKKRTAGGLASQLGINV